MDFRFALRSLGLVLAVSAGVPGLGQTQVWEKLVTPGLTYRMEVDLGTPRVVHALRYTPGGESVTARPELAKERIMIPEEPAKGRAALSRTVAAKGAIGGVNADFFPWTGDPLGLMVRMGELKSTPMAGRSAFAWGAGYFHIGPVDMRVRLSQGDVAFDLTGVNQEAGENDLVLSTVHQGEATAKVAAVHVILESTEVLRVGQPLSARVKLFVPDKTNQKVGEGEMVLTATGNRAAAVTRLKQGENVTILAESGSVDFSKAVNAVGGGPTLVRDGKAVNAAAAERFAADFSTARHPRTAVGVTANGDVWLVVVDGRQVMSQGATLAELAQVMLNLGCVQAINLDGGGSSTMNVAGLTVNRPSGGSEREISNSLLLFGNLPSVESSSAYVIKGVPRMVQGTATAYSVIDASGQTVPNSEVIWSSQGAAWVDQGGTLRAHAAGKATLSAWVRGAKVSVEVAVEAAPPKR